MASRFSEYTYSEDRRCTGSYLGLKPSLQLAQVDCAKDENCACIHDTDCNGHNWYLYTGQSIQSSWDCAWSKGTLG